MSFFPTALARALFDDRADPVFLVRPVGRRVVAANPAAHQFSGFTPSQLDAMSLDDLLRPGTVDRAAWLEEALRADGAVSSDRFLLRAASGDALPVVATFRSVPEGEECLTLVSLRADGPPDDAPRHVRWLLDGLGQCVFLKDARSRFLAVSRPFREALGLDDVAIVGKTDFDLFPAEVAARHVAEDHLILAEGRRVERDDQTVKDGRPRTVRIVKAPVQDEQGRPAGILGLCRDVTSERDFESQLRQAQKMEAIGQLAGGLAHDFNNLLTVILGNVSLLRAALPVDDPGQPLALAAERAAQRATALTHQLLGFARRGRLRTEPTSLNLAVEEVAGLLRQTIDPRIDLVTLPHPGLWPILGDPGQLTQVVLNLCLNARDALVASLGASEREARVVVETANVVVSPDDARRQIQARPGRFVRLRVTDTGDGIAADVLPRIFEPFFTTKGEGKGTGLGLAVVFGIVQTHHGWIDVTTAAGGGTTFDLYFPRLASVETIPPPAAQEPEASGGHETVLVVDDEPSLRELAGSVLRQRGYRVEFASDGLVALEVFRRDARAFDLVLLDLTMPRLSGRDTFRQMLQVEPATRVVFVSGYSSDYLSADDRARSFGFLSKPYHPDALAAVVRDALDRAARDVAIPPAESVSR